MTCCFACNGWNDSYSQGYADSPLNGDQTGYRFRVSRSFNRIMSSRVYCFTAAGKEHRMAAGPAGNFEAATIFGNSFNPQVKDGVVAQNPSGGGGLSPMPEVKFVS